MEQFVNDNSFHVVPLAPVELLVISLSFYPYHRLFSARLEFYVGFSPRRHFFKVLFIRPADGYLPMGKPQPRRPFFAYFFKVLHSLASFRHEKSRPIRSGLCLSMFAIYFSLCL